MLPPVNQDMKKKLKIAHAVTMGIVFVLMVIALKVIQLNFQLNEPYHNTTEIVYVLYIV